MISGRTAVFGIFGYPVEHTFSPGMHNAAFAKIGVEGCYVPFAVHPGSLGDAVRSIIRLGIRGVNITVPHKEKVLPFLDELAEDARLIGAVNTIEVVRGKLIGHNTDGRGFVRSLREAAGFRPRGKAFLMVGTGGAARAISFSLALAGAETILLYDIDTAKAKRLARDVRTRTGVRAEALTADVLPASASDVNVIINATPLGMRRGDPLPFSRNLIRAEHLICDLVYNPPETRLLKVARSRGAKTLSGIGMLLYQGVIAFEIWTGRKAPVSVMRQALSRQMRRG